MAHSAVLGALSIPSRSSSNHDSSLLLQRSSNPLLRLCSATHGRRLVRYAPSSLTTQASLSTGKESVLRGFRERKALKIISGLQNFDKDNVASVIIAADKGGATHVDIACDPELVKLAVNLTTLPICVSSVDPEEFLPAVEAGAQMVEIGNYDSFYDMGIQFSSEQILKLTQETKRILPFITLSVTVPHTISLPDQVKLAELLEQEGADIIQTEGGKCSSPSKPGILGLIEKATPTLAAAYTISRAVKIPVMCSSGLSAVTAPMALTAGAAGVWTTWRLDDFYKLIMNIYIIIRQIKRKCAISMILYQFMATDGYLCTQGVGSAVNKLNDVIAMIAEVRSIADSLRLSTSHVSKDPRTVRT